MADIERASSPESESVIELLDVVSKRIFERLPHTFIESERLRQSVDGVDISIMVEQAWDSGYTTFDILTETVDDEEIRTVVWYGWALGTDNGKYAISTTPITERGGIQWRDGRVSIEKTSDPSALIEGSVGPTETIAMNEILDLYDKSVRLAVEEDAKKNLFKKISFGGGILDIVQGSRQYSLGVAHLTSEAEHKKDKAVLLFSLSDDEIRTRLNPNNDSTVRITDENLAEVRAILQEIIGVAPLKNQE